MNQEDKIKKLIKKKVKKLIKTNADVKSTYKAIFRLCE